MDTVSMFLMYHVDFDVANKAARPLDTDRKKEFCTVTGKFEGSSYRLLIAAYR